MENYKKVALESGRFRSPESGRLWEVPTVTRLWLEKFLCYGKVVVLGGGRLRGMIAQEGLTVVDGFRIEGKERIFLRKTDIRVSFVFLTLSITILKVK